MGGWRLQPLAMLLAVLVVPGRVWADAASVSTSTVAGSDGETVYHHVCQGCHMPDAKGAVGAGHYPALANNPRLAEAGYPVLMVLNGHGGMPWFNGTLNDVQIARVVNYLRTHFGNMYVDAVSAADVAAVRGPVPKLER